MSVAKSQIVVLVSGVTGHVGSQVALTTLQAGYKVRGVVRDRVKADIFTAKHSKYADRLSFIYVEDFTKPGAFDEAVKGVDYFIHTASPLSNPSTEDNESAVLKPAINGTLEALRSAAKEPNLKRVVITSSVAAAIGDLDPADRVGKVYTEKDWFPATYEDAKNSKAPYFVYSASKVLAEKAAWDFVKETKPGFALTAILPSIVYGENQSGLPIDLNDERPIKGTNNAIATALNPNKDVTKILAPRSFIDVRDLAAAHLLGAEHPAAAGERFIVAQTSYPTLKYLEFFSKEFPGRKLASIPEGYTSPKSNDIDGSKVQRVLGLKLHDPEETLRDTANWLISVLEPQGNDTMVSTNSMNDRMQKLKKAGYSSHL